MTLRAFLITTLFWLLPSNASAAPSTIMSGEHDGFTRLVVQKPSGTAWSARQSDHTVELQLEGHADGFDTSQVYDRIAKDRIAAVTGAEAVLTLQLDCDCSASIFPSGADYLVIDIASPGVSLPTALLKNATEQVPVVVAADGNAPSAIPPEPTEAGPAPEPETKNDLARVRPRPIPLSPLDRAQLDAAEREALSAMHDRLARELGLATTRGVLQPKTSAPALPSAIRRPQIDTTTLGDAPAETGDLPETLPTRTSNMRISSSMDLPISQQALHDDITAAGVTCPEDKSVAVQSWGAEDAFGEQISQGRSTIFGEFDRLNHDAALKLAKSYIYFGFGAEARQVLQMDPGLAIEHRVLIDMADILDLGHARHQEYLQVLIECETDIALWAILALEKLPSNTALPTAAALRALNRLPVHLRKLLAPVLSRRFLAQGYGDAAAAALRSLERLPEKLPASAKLAQAHIALDEGHVDVGTARLEDVIDDNSEQSPEALITLVETQLATDQPISFDTANLVEAYAHELRDTALGPRLRRAHIMALIKSNQFDRAFSEAEHLDGFANTQEAAALRLSMLQELTAAADDIVFLDHVFHQEDADLALLAPDDQISLASRLLSLGFAPRADQVLGLVPDQPRRERRQKLAARIALALEHPFQAQVELLGLSDPETTMLRAQAKSMAGAFEEAHGLYQETDHLADATQAAWLASDWRALISIQTPVFGPAAQLSETRVSAPVESDGMLARSAAALDESATARSTLAELLAVTSLPIETVD